MTHPLIGSNVTFDSWSLLCKKAIEVAEREASEILQPKFKSIALRISDEIVEMAEEIAEDGA